MIDMKRILPVLAVLLFVTVSPAYAAVVTPSFPVCSAPAGNRIASFDSGIHGIVGSSATFSGSDRVYAVSDATFLQCFCSSSGEGIQSNWWNASALNEDQIKELQTSGWLYVPNGNVWGLQSGPFVVQNSSYSCLASPPGGIGGEGDHLSDHRSDNRSSCPECTQPPAIGGSVLGESAGEVLGLADTGDIVKILSIFAYASVFFTIGMILSRKKSHR
jgi:hypothetical protein